MMKRHVLAGLVTVVVFIAAAGGATAGGVPEMTRDGVFGATWITNIAADQYFGITIYRLFPQRAGWFVEGKFGRQMTYESSDYYENISIGQAEDWGDQLLQEDESFDTFNAGLTFAYTKSFALYLGLGLSDVDSYRQYHDEFRILGDNGDYWIDGDVDGQDFNMVGGAIIRTSEWVAIQVGFDSKPKGLNLGIGLAGTWPLVR